MSEEVKKITKEELEKVTELIGKSNNLVMQLGSLEVSKDGLIQQFKANQVLIEKSKTDLQDTYGNVSIDLSDGSFTDAEEVKEDEAVNKDGE